MSEINDPTEVRAIYQGATRNPKFRSCVDLVEATAREHSLPPTEIDTRLKMLIHLLRLAQHSGIAPGELGQVEGKSVLDLACGGIQGDITMQPWFCRLAHKLGCNVTGVDLPEAEAQEPWKFLGMDLTKPAGLFHFPDSSVDIVHSTYFIMNEDPGKDDCPLFRESLDKDLPNAGKILEGIVWQMQRIVKPEGVIILNDSSFDKRGRQSPLQRTMR